MKNNHDVLMDLNPKLQLFDPKRASGQDGGQKGCSSEATVK